MKVSIQYKKREYEILIDDEDYDKIKDLNLTITTDYRYKKIVRASGISLHRYIIHSKPNQICIHKNNDRFDFRKDNLFITTQKELNELVRKGEIQQRFDELDRIYYEF